ncbi:Uncharacterised protein [Mycobacterium tuberculosis]|nr:Uncharacterised protein [Mycobacterium tuberculosis]
MGLPRVAKLIHRVRTLRDTAMAALASPNFNAGSWDPPRLPQT